MSPTLAAIVAHPDDDTFGCAGTVALHADDPDFRFVLVHLTSGEAGRIADPALATRETLGAIRDVTVRGWGGAKVQMWITYPPDFDPKKKWPLLHSIHGGPHSAHLDMWHFRWNTQVFAGEGYVVVAVNYHGSSGFGYAFLDSITHRWGALELQDVEAALAKGGVPGDPQAVFQFVQTFRQNPRALEDPKLLVSDRQLLGVLDVVLEQAAQHPLDLRVLGPRRVAAGMGVTPDTFREAFSGVTPARGRGPTGDEARKYTRAAAR